MIQFIVHTCKKGRRERKGMREGAEYSNTGEQCSTQPDHDNRKTNRGGGGGGPNEGER